MSGMMMEQRLISDPCPCASLCPPQDFVLGLCELVRQPRPVADNSHATPCGTQYKARHKAISDAALAGADSLKACADRSAQDATIDNLVSVV